MKYEEAAFVPEFIDNSVRSHESKCILVNNSLSRAHKLEEIADSFEIYSSELKKSRSLSSNLTLSGRS